MMPESGEMLVVVVKRKYYLRCKWKDWLGVQSSSIGTGRKAEYITADPAW